MARRESKYVFIALEDRNIQRSFVPIDVDGHAHGEFGVSFQIEYRPDGIAFFRYAIIRQESGTYFLDTQATTPEESIALLHRVLAEVDQQKLQEIYAEDAALLKKNDDLDLRRRMQLSFRDGVPNGRVGAVYLFRSGDKYKIGQSVTPEKRIQSMTLPHKPEILVVHYTEQWKEAERELHMRFADKRAHGEWFEFTKEEIPEVEKAIRTF